MHIAEVAREIAPGNRAMLLPDQAGWHLSAKLVVPENITLVPLPPKCPELNPVENIWRFPRDKLAIEPHLHKLRKHSRPLLRRLE